MEGLTYFLEKSSTLIRKLIEGEGDAKSRLRDAEFDLYFLMSFDVPKHLEPLKEKIASKISHKPNLEFNSKVHTSSFQNSISGIRNATASKIIGDIYSLHLEMRGFRDDEKKKKSSK